MNLETAQGSFISQEKLFTIRSMKGIEQNHPQKMLKENCMFHILSFSFLKLFSNPEEI